MQLRKSTVATASARARAAGAPAAPPALERKIRRARWALFFERLWPRLWLVLAIAGLFVLVSLCGLWMHLDESTHKVVLAGFAITLLGALVPVARTAWPTREEGVQRIERVSGVPHRPASSYEDQVSSAPADSAAGQLWQAHRDRLQRLLDRLRVGPPSPRTDRYDPIGLRVLLALGIVVAYAFAGDSVSDRLRSAFRFGPSQAQIAEARLDAWVTPPAYTGRPPVMLADGARGGIRPDLKGDVIEVPERSQIVVRTAGTVLKALTLEIEPDGGPVTRLETDAEAPLTEGRPAGVIELKSELMKSGTVRVVTRGVRMVSWRFKVIPDLPPKIALTKDPETLPRGAMKLSYKVEDDYGVVSIEGRIRRAPRKAGDPATAWARPKPKTGPRLPLIRPPHLVLRLPRDNAKTAEGASFHELSAHPWAGTRVRLGLTAKDAVGQSGRSDIVEFVLPARQFRKMLARAIVEQRRKLVEDSRNVPDVLDGIEAITFGADDFNMDRGVYLGLRSVYHRLLQDRTEKTPHGTRQVLASAIDHLWHIALRAEDGNLSAAERRLRDAQDRLAEALKNGASDEELRKLMQELRQALNEFLNEMQRNAQSDDKQPRDQNSRELSSRDLERMLRDLENMARQGDREMAQQMLNELRDMLERLQPGGRRQADGQGQELMEMMDEFGNIIGREQQLLDDTFKQNRRRGERGDRGDKGDKGKRGEQGPRGGEPGGDQPGDPGEGRDGLGERQSGIGDALRGLQDRMRRFGLSPPDALGEAERAMRDAEQALKDGDLDRALREEQRALDKLREGAQQLAEAMRQMMQSERGPAGDAPLDPLGRPQRSEGADPGSSVKVPDDIDTQRAREILEELRRRSGERTRPPVELDYIDRLLRRF